jgi:hypothetical protein
MVWQRDLSNHEGFMIDYKIEIFESESENAVKIKFEDGRLISACIDSSLMYSSEQECLYFAIEEISKLTKENEELKSLICKEKKIKIFTDNKAAYIDGLGSLPVGSIEKIAEMQILIDSIKREFSCSGRFNGDLLESVIRNFWLDTYKFRDQYFKYLPDPIPSEIMAAMARAFSFIEYRVDSLVNKAKIFRPSSSGLTIQELMSEIKKYLNSNKEL